jgi:nitrate/nitrite transporter NarK
VFFCTQFGRTLPGILADKIGRFNILIVSGIGSGAITYGLIGALTTGPIIAVSQTCAQSLPMLTL